MTKTFDFTLILPLFIVLGVSQSISRLQLLPHAVNCSMRDSQLLCLVALLTVLTWHIKGRQTTLILLKVIKESSLSCQFAIRSILYLAWSIPTLVKVIKVCVSQSVSCTCVIGVNKIWHSMKCKWGGSTQSTSWTIVDKRCNEVSTSMWKLFWLLWRGGKTTFFSSLIILKFQPLIWLKRESMSQ